MQLKLIQHSQMMKGSWAKKADGTLPSRIFLAMSCDEKARLEDNQKHFLISTTGDFNGHMGVENFLLKLVELTETKAGKPAEGA